MPPIAQIAFLWESFLKASILYLPTLMLGVLVLAAFCVAGLTLERLIGRLGKARGMDGELADFLARSVRVTCFVVGGICALGTFGVDVTALVAGLGLTGFALGFALKDIISNVLAGILVLIYRPFSRNDRILVAAFEGEVKAIDLRYTILQADDRTIFVPNSLLFSNAVTVLDRGSPEA